MAPVEIYLAAFPFGDVPGMKLRPVLLLTGSIGLIPEVLVAYISSVIPERLLASDIILDPSRPEFYGCNLKVVSALCTSLRRSIAPVCCAAWGRLMRSIKMSWRTDLEVCSALMRRGSADRQPGAGYDDGKLLPINASGKQKADQRRCWNTRKRIAARLRISAMLLSGVFPL